MAGLIRRRRRRAGARVVEGFVGGAKGLESCLDVTFVDPFLVEL